VAVPAITAVRGLGYTASYLTTMEQERLLATIDGLPWPSPDRRAGQPGPALDQDVDLRVPRLHFSDS
jgi:hypothetical protein